MDPKALYSLSYGVFMLAVSDGGKVNGCITNTCMQVASSPTRLAISCLNSNLTCEMLKNSGRFTLSILDSTCTFETIKHFGLQSGRTVNKFEDLELPTDAAGIPYLSWATCAVISCHVIQAMDLGSHTMFIAEIDDAFRCSDNPPLTYADYQSRLKPKTGNSAPVQKKIVGWRCKICQYEYKGSELPADFLCPLCGHDASDFEPIYEA
ncbi:MAG: flavin reductase [Clostridia bacterium]|nr:flavin reductase [Clostridia bacterium]